MANDFTGFMKEMARLLQRSIDPEQPSGREALDAPEGAEDQPAQGARMAPEPLKEPEPERLPDIGGSLDSDNIDDLVDKIATKLLASISAKLDEKLGKTGDLVVSEDEEMEIPEDTDPVRAVKMAEPVAPVTPDPTRETMIVEPLPDIEDEEAEPRINVAAARKAWERKMRLFQRGLAHHPGAEPDAEMEIEPASEEDRKAAVHHRAAVKQWQRRLRLYNRGLGPRPGEVPTLESIRADRESLDAPPGDDVIHEPEPLRVKSEPPEKLDSKGSKWSEEDLEKLFSASEEPFSPGDPEILSLDANAKQQTDEQLGSRQIVEEMLQMQDDMSRVTNSVNNRTFDFLERLALDANNDFRRINSLTHALERGRETLTDVNI